MRGRSRARALARSRARACACARAASSPSTQGLRCACLRRVARFRGRRRAASELVLPADRAALRNLLDEARRAAAEARPCETFAQLHHACGHAVAWQLVELKACTDGEYMYCVLLDARVPARLESVLPQFLLSTCALALPRHGAPAPRLTRPAGHDLRTPCCSVQAATALLLSLPAVAADPESCNLLHTVDASCEVLLRCVSNVLHMRQLQRAGPMPLQLPPRGRHGGCAG